MHERNVVGANGADGEGASTRHRGPIVAQLQDLELKCSPARRSLDGTEPTAESRRLSFEELSIERISVHAAMQAGGAREGERPMDASTAYMTRSEEHTSELQSQSNLVCRLLL